MVISQIITSIILVKVFNFLEILEDLFYGTKIKKGKDTKQLEETNSKYHFDHIYIYTN